VGPVVAERYPQRLQENAIFKFIFLGGRISREESHDDSHAKRAL
jgi:hypothetical protein